MIELNLKQFCMVLRTTLNIVLAIVKMVEEVFQNSYILLKVLGEKNMPTYVFLCKSVCARNDYVTND